MFLKRSTTKNRQPGAQDLQNVFEEDEPKTQKSVLPTISYICSRHHLIGLHMQMLFIFGC